MMVLADLPTWAYALGIAWMFLVMNGPDVWQNIQYRKQQDRERKEYQPPAEAER